MRWLMGLFERFTNRDPHVSREQLRDEMTQTDPDFARVRGVHHEALQALSAKRGADGMAIRREREFWEHHGGHSK